VPLPRDEGASKDLRQPCHGGINRVFEGGKVDKTQEFLDVLLGDY